MAMIQKANQIVSFFFLNSVLDFPNILITLMSIIYIDILQMTRAFIELDLDPEDFVAGKETKMKPKREMKIVQIFS